MPLVEHPIRPPVGRYWMLLLANVVVAGELVYERASKKQSVIFSISWSDRELLIGAVLAALAATVAGLFLATAYLRPGCLRLDGAHVERISGGLLSRRKRARASEWRVSLRYFSARDQERGTFKSLELAGPDTSEVLLFGDVPQGEALARDLEKHRDSFGKFEVSVDRARSE